jgi:transcriptional regulator with XRE-family HTH domain
VKNSSSVVALLLAERVKHLRKTRNLSQEAFAELVGIDRTYQSQIERAIANPSLEVLCRVANGLDVELVELFKRHDT